MCVCIRESERGKGGRAYVYTCVLCVVCVCAHERVLYVHMRVCLSQSVCVCVFVCVRMYLAIITIATHR